MQKRFTIAVRRGAYNVEAALYGSPICFEDTVAATQAMEQLKSELAHIPDTRLRVINQPMKNLRLSAADRYDERGDFPQLYPLREEEFSGYVVQLDLPDDPAIEALVKNLIAKLKLEIIDEGPVADKILEFIA